MSYTSNRIPPCLARQAPAASAQQAAFLNYLIDPPRCCTELRVIDVEMTWGGEFRKTSRFPRTFCAWSDDPARISQEEARVVDASIYVNINPVRSDLRLRGDRLQKQRAATRDEDIVALCHILIDIDCVRDARVQRAA
jgi:hypothetical protein